MVQPLWKKSMEVPPKVKRRITTYMPQRIQGKNQKRDSYTQVHSSTKVEATQRLLRDEWVYKMRSISIVEYLSAIKREF